MTIKAGDRLPEGTLYESPDFDPDKGCPMKPLPQSVLEQCKGKKIIVFGVPGAFTPTCTADHLPGYIRNYDQFRAKGVDEIWCMAVNDGYVMGAWGRDQNAAGKVRMMGDGSALWSKALGVDLDFTEKGMGIRCQRFAMIVDDGVIVETALEDGGKLAVSGAEDMLAKL